MTFQREGAPEALFNHISGTLRRDGDRISLEGVAADSEWGNWTIAGERAGADAPFKLKLHTDHVRLTPDKLERVPFLLQRIGLRFRRPYQSHIRGPHFPLLPFAK